MATEPIVLKTKVDTTGVKEGKKTIQDVIGQLDNELSKSGKEIEKALSQGSAKSADLAQKLQIANKELAESSREAMNLKEQLDNINNATTSDNIVKKSKETLSIEKEVAKWQKNINDLGKEQLEIETQIANAKRILSDSSASTERQFEARGALTVATEKQTALNNKIRDAQIEYDRLSEAYDKAFSKDKQNAVDKVTAKLNTQQTKVAKLTTKTQTLGDKLSDSMKKSLPEMDKFTKRVVGLAKRVFVFTIITRAFRAIRDYFGELSQGNAEFQQSLANLKFALQVLVTPLYNTVLPILKIFVDYLTKVIMILVNLIAKLTGKSVDSIMKNTKALQKQSKALKDTAKSAKEARKELAAFDQLNILGDDKINDLDDLTPNTYQPNSGQLSALVSGAFSEVEETISEFLFVLGAILICFGAIGPGITLLVLGAIGKYEKYKENKEKARGDVNNLLDIMSDDIISDGLIVIGTILCVFGQVGLGAFLIATGAIKKGYKKLMESDKVSDDVKDMISEIMLIGGTLFVVLGIILCLIGNVALGAGLILMGSTMLYETYKLNKGHFKKLVDDTIKDIKESLDKFGTWINENLIRPYLGDGLADSLDDAKTDVKNFVSDIKELFSADTGKGWWHPYVNVLIGALNILIDGLNALTGLADGTVGKLFGLPKSYKIPRIPRLATGAVLPPNKPFLAQLGDQKNGRNLELPENLLRQIVREEVNTNFTIEATGSMSQLIKLLNLKITQEQKRVSVF